MCHLIAKLKSKGRKEYICAGSSFKYDFPIINEIFFANEFLRLRSPEIADWMEVVEDAFGIDVVPSYCKGEGKEYAWKLPKDIPYNLTHFAILLVRQTVESEERIKLGVEYEHQILNPLKIAPQNIKDPLGKFLWMTRQGFFSRSDVHGLLPMCEKIKRKGLSLYKFKLKKAIEDLRKTEIMINDFCIFHNKLIGYTGK